MNATAHDDGDASSLPEDSLTPIQDDHNYEWYQFIHGKDAAAKVTGSLRKDYPSLKPYLVLTMKGEYVNADSSVMTMLKEAPGIFFQNECKKVCMAHLRKKPPARLLVAKMRTKLDLWMKKWNEEFEDLSVELRFLPDAFFKIRFGHLDYEEIWRMQKDERVDVERTPLTRASIRIVLGSLEEFVTREED